MLCCIAVGINGYAHYRPEQVHLSLGENYRDIVVTWSTSQPTKDSIVKYAKFGVATPLDQLDFVAEGTENLFVDGGEKKRSQYIHRVTLSNLKPNSIYSMLSEPPKNPTYVLKRSSDYKHEYSF